MQLRMGRFDVSSLPAEQGVRWAYRDGINPGLLAKRQQQAFIAEYVLERRGLKFPVFCFGTQLPCVATRQSQEARYPLRIVGQKPQRLQGDRLGVIEGQSIGS